VSSILGVDVLGEPDVSVWDVALAVVVLVAAWLFARAARNATSRVTARLQGLSADVRRTLSHLVFWFVLLVGVGVAISVLGADIQPLQSAAIIVAVVAVIAMRGVVAQFAAGIVLQSTHPYRVGDHIETCGHTGVVREITSYSTVVETYDGPTVYVPNTEVATNPIVNRSAGGVRADVEVRARTSDDPAELLDVISRTASTVAGVLDRPAPIVTLAATEPERVTVLVRLWHAAASDGPPVASAVVLAVRRRLAELHGDASVVTPPPRPPFTPSPPV
jgi:small-conductance mechanosensitive channel